jgi:4-hydroxybenzoate polyprenyltransferase
MPKNTVRWLLWQLAQANIVLAVSTAAAVYVVGLLLGLPPSPLPALILFLVTFAVYNFNRHTDRNEDRINHPKRVAFIRKYGRGLVIISVFAYMLAIMLSLYGGSGAQLIVMLPLVALLLYSLRWFPKNGDATKRLKEIFIIKNIVVSGAWAGTVVFLPVLYFQVPVTTFSVLVFMFFFFRFFINTIVFDLRDITGDEKNGINSMPVVLGYERTWHVLHAINLLLGLLFIAGLMIGILPQITLPLIFSMIFSFIYLSYLRFPRNIHFVCDVIVDGEYFALASFYFLLTLLSVLP